MPTKIRTIGFLIIVSGISKGRRNGRRDLFGNHFLFAVNGWCKHDVGAQLLIPATFDLWL